MYQSDRVVKKRYELTDEGLSAFLHHASMIDWDAYNDEDGMPRVTLYIHTHPPTADKKRGICDIIDFSIDDYLWLVDQLSAVADIACHEYQQLIVDNGKKLPENACTLDSGGFRVRSFGKHVPNARESVAGKILEYVNNH